LPIWRLCSRAACASRTSSNPYSPLKVTRNVLSRSPSKDFIGSALKGVGDRRCSRPVGAGSARAIPPHPISTGRGREASQPPSRSLITTPRVRVARKLSRQGCQSQRIESDVNATPRRRSRRNVIGEATVAVVQRRRRRRQDRAISALSCELVVARTRAPRPVAI